jgi:hypothetical protein
MVRATSVADVADVARASLLPALCAQIDKAFNTNDPARPHTIMGAPYDFAPERPDHIQQILDGLDRYNPETTGVFQDYVMQQCESQTYDCYANLALLKLYVGRSATTSHMSHDEQRTTTFPITRGMGLESLRPLKFIISSI